MHIGNNVGGEVNSSYQWGLGTTGIGVELRKELLVSSNLGERNRFVSQVFFEHHFSLLDKKLNISREFHGPIIPKKETSSIRGLMWAIILLPTAKCMEILQKYIVYLHLQIFIM
jgi:hypothetical protein